MFDSGCDFNEPPGGTHSPSHSETASKEGRGVLVFSGLRKYSYVLRTSANIVFFKLLTFGSSRSVRTVGKFAAVVVLMNTFNFIQSIAGIVVFM